MKTKILVGNYLRDFSCLPTEVLLHIFSGFTTIAVRPCLLVCTTICKLLQSLISRIKEVFVPLYSSWQYHRFVEFIDFVAV